MTASGRDGMAAFLQLLRFQFTFYVLLLFLSVDFFSTQQTCTAF